MRKTCITLFLSAVTYFDLGAQLTTLHSFNGLNGKFPMGSLVSDGTFLYGTSSTGTMVPGSLFKIMPNGTGFSTIYSFSSAADGQYPYGSLYYDGTYLYGMNSSGGTAGNGGTIFRILPNGTGYTVIHSFSGADGAGATGALISDGTFLYGMTRLGGSSSDGLIFKIMPDGTLFSVLHEFNAATEGAHPNGSLFYDGTALYGTTEEGGSTNDGTVFKILTNGTGFTTLVDFVTTNGQYPSGSLVSDGTYLYGTTSFGGSTGHGTLFKLLPNGTGFTTFLTFNGGSDGSHPYGDLTLSGGFFYGLTGAGGNATEGTLFRIMPDGTNYVKLFDFNSFPNGRDPFGSVIDVGGVLYGTTAYGGGNDYGTLFRYNILTNIRNVSNSFSYSVYPNPTQGEIHVQTTLTTGTVYIQDIFGKVVHTQEFDRSEFCLDIAHLATGIYYIHMQPGETITEKMIPAQRISIIH